MVSTFYTSPADVTPVGVLNAIGTFLTANGWTLIDSDWSTASTNNQRAWQHIAKGWVVVALSNNTSFTIQACESFDAASNTMNRPLKSLNFTYAADGYPDGTHATFVSPTYASAQLQGYSVSTNRRAFMVTSATDGFFVFAYEQSSNAQVFALDTYTPFSPGGATVKNLACKFGTFIAQSGSVSTAFTQLPGVTVSGSSGMPTSSSTVIGPQEPIATLDAITGRPILVPMLYTVPFRLGAYAGTWMGQNANLYPVGRFDHLFLASIGTTATIGDTLQLGSDEFYLFGGSTATNYPSLAVLK